MNKHAAKEKAGRLNPCPNEYSRRWPGRPLVESSTNRANNHNTVVHMPLRYNIINTLSTLFLDAWVFLAKTGISLMKVSPLLLSGDFLARSWRGGRVYRFKNLR